MTFIAGLGLADGREIPPSLDDAALQLASHIEAMVAADRESPFAGGLSLSGAVGTYDNSIPAPTLVAADDRMKVERAGIGLIGEVRIVACPVVFAAGVGPYLVHTKATASGWLTFVPIDYSTTSDTTLGFEARAGVDVRVGERALVGLRAGWLWYEAELGAFGYGALGGPWGDLRVAVEFDASPQ